MDRRNKNPFRYRKSIRAGIKVAVFILTVLATVEIARIGWETFQSRAGAPGGEALILPLIVLLFYTGWSARKEWDIFCRDFKRTGGKQHAISNSDTPAYKG